MSWSSMDSWELLSLLLNNHHCWINSVWRAPGRRGNVLSFIQVMFSLFPPEPFEVSCFRGNYSDGGPNETNIILRKKKCIFDIQCRNVTSWSCRDISHFQKSVSSQNWSKTSPYIFSRSEGRTTKCRMLRPEKPIIKRCSFTIYWAAGYPSRLTFLSGLCPQMPDSFPSFWECVFVVSVNYRSLQFKWASIYVGGSGL